MLLQISVTVSATLLLLCNNSLSKLSLSHHMFLYLILYIRAAFLQRAHSKQMADKWQIQTSLLCKWQFNMYVLLLQMISNFSIFPWTRWLIHNSWRTSRTAHEQGKRSTWCSQGLFLIFYFKELACLFRFGQYALSRPLSHCAVQMDGIKKKIFFLLIFMKPLKRCGQMQWGEWMSTFP